MIERTKSLIKSERIDLLSKEMTRRIVNRERIYLADHHYRSFNTNLNKNIWKILIEIEEKVNQIAKDWKGLKY